MDRGFPFRILRLSRIAIVQVPRKVPDPFMRFILSEDHWVLDSLFPGEWEWIRMLPGLAAGEGFSRSSCERLFPSPLAPEVLADVGTISQMEDWDELVRPELEELFASARAVVEGDLSRCQTYAIGADDDADDDEEDPFREELEELGLPVELPELRRVIVPFEHTEAWYSTLNQARLLMNEEFDLATAEERHLAKTLGPEIVGSDRLLLIAQYELYSFIQSILVEKVMED
jgi:hypothetical protein